MPQSKDQRRKKKVFDKQKRADARKEREAFPAFVLDGDEPPKEFAEAVVAALHHVDFTNRDMFYSWEEYTYRLMKQYGASRANYHLRTALDAYDWCEVAISHFLCNIGHIVFRLIKDDFLRRFIPFHDVHFQPSDHDIKVIFRSLQQARGAGGTVYYSRHKPTLNIDGKDYIVAFSGHAIHRTCERISATWPSYAANGDVFAFFDQCLEFERHDLYGNQLAFTFFEEAHSGHAQLSIVETILGDKYIKGVPYSYRIGYCPAVIEGEFLKATTLLYPGYRSTPEYGLMLAHRLPQKAFELASLMDFRAMMQNDIVGLLKWFHDHGCEQVRQGAAEYAHIETGNSALHKPTAFRESIDQANRTMRKKVAEEEKRFLAGTLLSVGVKSQSASGAS